MVYSAKVILPTDLDHRALWILVYDEAKAEKDRQDTLD
jgi:hypothetical protein